MSRADPPVHAPDRHEEHTKATFAVAHMMIVIVWLVVHDDATYEEFSADFFDRRTDTEARQRHSFVSLKPSATKSRSNPQPERRPLSGRAPPGPWATPVPISPSTQEFRVRSLRRSRTVHLDTQAADLRRVGGSPEWAVCRR